MDLTFLSMADSGHWLSFPQLYKLVSTYLNFFSAQTCHDYKVFLDKTALDFDD